MDEFSWFMDEERLDLLNTLIDPSAMTFQELVDRDQSNFFSLHEDQDGLHFSALRPRTKWTRRMWHAAMCSLAWPMPRLSQETAW